VGAYGVSSDAGAAYVYLGRDLASATPVALPSVDGSDSFFGEAVACAGDLNGDGLADLAIGSSGSTSATGRVFVFYGAAGGLSPAPSVTLTGPDGTDVQFGSSVDTAGDVDRDGYADLIVGAPRYMSATGRAYVFHGSAMGLVSPARTTLTGVDGADAELGRSVSGLGDLDGDGFDDVGVGAPNVTMLTGRAYSLPGQRARRDGGDPCDLHALWWSWLGARLQRRVGARGRLRRSSSRASPAGMTGALSGRGRSWPRPCGRRRRRRRGAARTSPSRLRRRRRSPDPCRRSRPRTPPLRSARRSRRARGAPDP
jgi:hypothetical protein